MLLAIKSGRSPGFDPSHPAAAGICGGYGFSALPVGNTWVSLLTGKIGTTVGTPTAVNGRLGPGVSYSGTQKTTFSGNKITSTLMATLACVYEVATPAAGISQMPIGSGNTSASGGSQIKIGPTSSFTLNYTNWGGGGFTFTPNINLTSGDPWFVAMSYSGRVTSSSCGISCVAKNLKTGKLSFAQQTGAVGFFTNDGVYAIGSSPSANAPCLGILYAVMMCDTYLPAGQLVKWADDPWSFWYPRRLPELMFRKPRPQFTVQYQYTQPISMTQ